MRKDTVALPTLSLLRLRDGTCLFLTSESVMRDGLNLGTSASPMCQTQCVAIRSLLFSLWLTPTAVCHCSSCGMTRGAGLSAEGQQG